MSEEQKEQRPPEEQAPEAVKAEAPEPSAEARSADDTREFAEYEAEREAELRAEQRKAEKIVPSGKNEPTPDRAEPPAAKAKPAAAEKPVSKPPEKAEEDAPQASGESPGEPAEKSADDGAGPGKKSRDSGRLPPWVKKRLEREHDKVVRAKDAEIEELKKQLQEKVKPESPPAEPEPQAAPEPKDEPMAKPAPAKPEVPYDIADPPLDYMFNTEEEADAAFDLWEARKPWRHLLDAQAPGGPPEKSAEPDAPVRAAPQAAPAEPDPAPTPQQEWEQEFEDRMQAIGDALDQHFADDESDYTGQLSELLKSGLVQLSVPMIETLSDMALDNEPKMAAVVKELIDRPQTSRIIARKPAAAQPKALDLLYARSKRTETETNGSAEAAPDDVPNLKSLSGTGQEPVIDTEKMEFRDYEDLRRKELQEDARRQGLVG